MADWLQGWGTVAGAVFAAAAATTAAAVLRHDRAARRRDDNDAAAGQARSVVVLLDAQWELPELTEIGLVLHNFSPEVIFDIGIAYRRRDTAGIPGDTIGMDFVKPHGSSRWAVTLDPPLPIADAPFPPDLIETRLLFTDARGRRWHRRSRDQPTRVGVRGDPDLATWVTT